MTARTQYRLSASDLDVVLALARGGTLAAAGERLGVDPSTVFRSIQRVERGLGQALFERSRAGYVPLPSGQALAGHAEQMEVHLESARSALQLGPEQVSGTVRITTTDTVLHGLLAPALQPLRAMHPHLTYELHAGNELASLTRRDADIAVRATRRPPQHLVGKHLGPVRMALYAAKKAPLRRFDEARLAAADWVGPDDALPDHPSVLWRRKHFPKVVPAWRVNSILTVLAFVAQGLGVGLLPLFLAQGRNDLRALTEPLDECRTELWLLAHAESRHLRRVSAVFGHLSRHMLLT